MRYTVFHTFSESRKESYYKIHKRLMSRWTCVGNLAYDGENSEQMARGAERFPLHFKIPFRKGHIGIWYGVLTALELVGDEPLLTLEDDALLSDDFVERVESLEIPEDADYIALYVCPNQAGWYHAGWQIRSDTGMVVTRGGHYPDGNPRFKHDENLARAFQNYGGVGMIYTPNGARNILKLVRETGLDAQYDDYLFKYDRLERLKGYTLNPDRGLIIMTNREPEASIAQNSEFI